VSEVASIAADSNAAVATLQYMVEYIHLTFDLPWCGRCTLLSAAVQHLTHDARRPRRRWLAIAASTCALRAAIAPLTVLQMKNTAKLSVRRVGPVLLQMRYP
jgi:membrane protein insertase Oxa1/YidC/SpoIIIJ